VNAGIFAASFAALYAAHTIGDHVIQTDHQAAEKAGKGWPAARAMAGHVGTYLACQAVALGVLILVGAGPTVLGAALGLAFSGATHAFIDRRWPVQWILRHTGSPNFAGLASHGMNGPYLTDQSLHIGCLFVAALIAGAAT
jgi:hypothetical protein